MGIFGHPKPARAKIYHFDQQSNPSRNDPRPLPLRNLCSAIKQLDEDYPLASLSGLDERSRKLMKSHYRVQLARIGGQLARQDATYSEDDIVSLEGLSCGLMDKMRRRDIRY